MRCEWDVYAKGYISDPKSKSKSVVVTEEGVKRQRWTASVTYIFRPVVQNNYRSTRSDSPWWSSGLTRRST